MKAIVKTTLTQKIYFSAPLLVAYEVSDPPKAEPKDPPLCWRIILIIKRMLTTS